MDIKHLRPRVFVADPESGDSKRQWKHWFKSFTTLPLILLRCKI